MNSIIKNFKTGLALLTFFFIAYTLPQILSKLNSVKQPTYETDVFPVEFFSRFDTFDTGSLDARALTTLSASPESSRAILIVVAITFISMFSIYRAHHLKIMETISLGFAILVGNFFLLMQVDDLPDEGYVWASKIVNFVESGVLGVQLDTGPMGESTVGFLQFLLAAGFMAIGFTVEQSIYIPILASLTISQVLLYAIVAKHTKSKFYALVSVLIVFVLPVLGYNFAFAFDNVMAYSFLIIWTFFELNSCKETKHKARILLVVIFPLVRLDFAIVSLAIFVLHVFENKLFSIRSVIVEIRCNLAFYASSMCLFLVWVIYKLWAFGDLVPAMASYKSFHWDSGFYLYSLGIKYLITSLNLEVILSPIPVGILTLLMIRLYAWKWINRSISQEILQQYSIQIAPIQKLLTMNFVFFFVTSVLAVIAGGDYFGPQLVRYQFPFLILIFLLLFLKLHTFSRVLRKSYLEKTFPARGMVRIDLQIALSLSLLTLLMFFRPDTPSNYLADIAQVDKVGRVTCEAAAGISLRELFPNMQTIATPEVNGISYHSQSSLIDLIALVDTTTTSDGFVGDSLHKFRITQSDTDILRTDVLWLWSAAECAESKTQLTQEEQHANRLYALASNFPGNFRVIDFSRYMDAGFKPIVVEYSFISSGKKFFGKAFVFVRL
jgi:hypothetical protein